MLCLVFAAAGPWMPGDGDVSPMDPTIAYGAAPTMLVFAPDGGAGFDLVRAFRTVPGLRWTGRASGTLGSRPASAPRGANCLRGCCMTRRAGTRRKRATTTSTLNTGGRRALSDRAACGGSVDRFLHVWASFRIHTGNWDVRLMYLWGEQSQGTPQLASTVVCFMFWHPRWSRTLPQ